MLRFKQSGDDDRDGFGFVAGDHRQSPLSIFPRHSPADFKSRHGCGYSKLHQSPYRLGFMIMCAINWRSMKYLDGWDVGEGCSESPRRVLAPTSPKEPPHLLGLGSSLKLRDRVLREGRRKLGRGKNRPTLNILQISWRLYPYLNPAVRLLCHRVLQTGASP